MADPCTCLQCRITRELYGAGPITTKHKLTAIASLMHVLADELADVDDASVDRIFAGIRAQHISKGQAAGDPRPNLADAEVAGHG